MTRLLLLCALFAPLLPGCSSVDFCGDLVDPWVTIGKGPLTGYETISEGEVLLVERGSQGAQHVWAALRAGGMHPGSEDVAEGLQLDNLPWIAFELESPEGLHNFDTRVRLPLDRLDNNTLFGLETRPVQFWQWVERPDDWETLNMTDLEESLEEVDFVLRVTIEDACGDSTSDEVGIRLDFPPRDEEARAYPLTD
jgi:hypothetical protein